MLSPFNAHQNNENNVIVLLFWLFEKMISFQNAHLFTDFQQCDLVKILSTVADRIVVATKVVGYGTYCMGK